MCSFTKAKPEKDTNAHASAWSGTFLEFSLCEHFFAHEIFNTSMGGTLGILVLVMLQKIPINTI